MAAPPHTAFPRSPIPSTTSYDSSSVSSTASPKISGIYEGGLMGASPRLLTGPLPPHLNRSSGLSLGQNSFHRPYSPARSSPGLGMEPMGSNDSSSGTPVSRGAQSSSATLQAQKRAYRQRRKDPSCDACSRSARRGRFHLSTVIKLTHSCPLACCLLKYFYKSNKTTKWTSFWTIPKPFPGPLR